VRHITLFAAKNMVALSVRAVADQGEDLLMIRRRDFARVFHRDVRAELFPEDWAGDVSAQGDFGKR
jgi:hypothetical protein